MPIKKNKKSKVTVNKEANRLVALRAKLGMSQRDLAQEFYVTPGAIAHWEQGNNPLPGPVLKLVEIYERKGR